MPNETTQKYLGVTDSGPQIDCLRCPRFLPVVVSSGTMSQIFGKNKLHALFVAQNVTTLYANQPF